MRLHALGPPEVAHICKLEGKISLGSASCSKRKWHGQFAGAGAEILNDRVRRLISRGKCTGQRMVRCNACGTSATHYHLRYHDVWAHRNPRRAL